MTGIDIDIMIEYYSRISKLIDNKNPISIDIDKKL